MKSQNLNQWTNILQKPDRTYTESELADFTSELFHALRAGDRLFLEGDLGSGKSALSRELLKHLTEEKFRGSPTFPLNLSYSGFLSARSAPLVIHHMDWYRIKSDEELEERGLIENIWNDEAICLIEWGSLFPETRDEIAKAFFSVEISILNSDENHHRQYKIRRL